MTEFSESLGYCQYKIPFFLEGASATPSVAMIKGSIMHAREELEERGGHILKPMTAGELLDTKFDFEFPREGVHTMLERDSKIEGRRVKVVLYGRTDKLKRTRGSLVLQEDKSVSNFKNYETRTEPYPNQILQALAYLNSKFSQGFSERPEDWFEVKHTKKRWMIRIVGNSGEIFKIFSGSCTPSSEARLESELTKFAGLVLRQTPFNHHNRAELCRPCGFFERCKFKINC